MPSDLQYVFIWWLTFLLVGIINLPLTFLVFRKFVDCGYGFSKTFGFIIITYLLFLGSITHLFKLTNLFQYSVLVIVSLANILIFRTHKKRVVSLFKKNLRVIIFQEILFSLGLIFWSFVRAHQPDINGLEKFMDFGFINSILRSDYLPPGDMWFAGKSINYYWFGHYFVAFLTKVSQIPSYITYNLMLATIMGLALTGVFSLVS